MNYCVARQPSDRKGIKSCTLAHTRFEATALVTQPLPKKESEQEFAHVLKIQNMSENVHSSVNRFVINIKIKLMRIIPKKT